MDKKYWYFMFFVDLNLVRFKLVCNGLLENFEFVFIYLLY